MSNFDPSDLPDRELTPTELRQLIESNARAIEANTESITAGFRETREAIAETNRTIDRLAEAVNTDLLRLARLMEGYFVGQAQTNSIMNEGLADHEQRISQLEQGGGQDG